MLSVLLKLPSLKLGIGGAEAVTDGTAGDSDGNSDSDDPRTQHAHKSRQQLL
jgi:hypothetical protein